MEILSSRETAIVIWTTLIFGWLIWKAKAWSLLGGIVRTFCKPIILRSVAMMGAYVALSVWLLATIGLWQLDSLKVTIIWFVMIALGWMFDLKRWEANPNDSARAALKDILSITTFVTFLAEFYTFHLAVELLLVPLVTFIMLISTFAQNRSGHELVAKVFGNLLAIVGCALLGYAVYRLIGDLRGFATVETGREFAVPALLSLLFIPFMYAFNIYAAYDIAFRTMPTRIKKGVAAPYALRRAVLSFGLDVELMRRWKTTLFIRGANTRADVDELIATMKAAKRREKNPPSVAPEEGWSPYAAISWLKDLGLEAPAYNPVYGWEWAASSPYRKLDGSVLGDRLSYHVRGNERAVTKLTLMLDRDRVSKETSNASLDTFAEALMALLAGALNEKAARAARGLKNKKRRTKEGFANIALSDSDFTIKLTITHQAHVEPHC